MEFEEILPSFKDGKKIRERCWGKQQYIVIGPNETIVNENGLIILLHIAGLKADDWEIFEEEKKDDGCCGGYCDFFGPYARVVTD